jgi:hypothetical protein
MMPMVISRTRLEGKNQEEYDSWRGGGGEEEEEEEEEDDDGGSGAAAAGGGVVLKVEGCHLFIAQTFSRDLKTSRHCLEAGWQGHVVSRRFFVPRMSFLVYNKTRLSFMSIF